MPFQQDVTFPGRIGSGFGTYHSTFHSETGQVTAQLFERDGWLIAHVWFAADLKAEQITDSYMGDLRRYAAEHGFEGRLRVIYSE